MLLDHVEGLVVYKTIPSKLKYKNQWILTF